MVLGVGGISQDSLWEIALSSASEPTAARWNISRARPEFVCSLVYSQVQARRAVVDEVLLLWVARPALADAWIDSAGGQLFGYRKVVNISVNEESRLGKRASEQSRRRTLAIWRNSVSA